MHIFLILLFASHPPHLTAADYVRMLNSEQQIINDLTDKNRVLAEENERMKTELYGPPGTKVYPRFENEKPVCPVNGFVVEFEVEDNGFIPYCVREK